MTEKTSKPTRKIAAVGVSGIITTGIISILSRRLNIDLSLEEANLLLLAVSTIAGYITPNKTPQEP